MTGPPHRRRVTGPAAGAAGAAAVTVLLGAAGLVAGAGGPPEDRHAAGGITVTGLYIREPVDGRASMYLTLRNDTDQPEALLSVYAGAARDAVIHSHPDTPEPADLGAGDPVEVRPGEILTLTPQGPHVALGRPIGPLQAGDRVSLVLNLGRAGRMLLTAPVLAANQSPPTTPAS